MTTTMSFARAFSTKRSSPEMPNSPSTFFGRATSGRNGRPNLRAQISSPTELISTSNAHVQTAHAIAGTRPIEIRTVSATSSIDSTSSDESDASSNSMLSNGTLTDASSIDESPTSYEPEPKRLSYFKPTIVDIKRSSQSLLEAVDPDATPKVPQRAPSHSKSAHESLHRQRSLQRTLQSAAPINETRSSYDMMGPYRSRTAPVGGMTRDKTSPRAIAESPQETPFDDELAQLEDVAREFEYTMRSAEEDADVIQMEKYGLASFSAADYMYEIQSLVHGMFADERPFFMHLGGFF